MSAWIIWCNFTSVFKSFRDTLNTNAWKWIFFRFYYGHFYQFSYSWIKCTQTSRINALINQWRWLNVLSQSIPVFNGKMIFKILIRFLKTFQWLNVNHHCYLEEYVVVHILNSIKVLWTLYGLYQFVFVDSTQHL